jgi:hypothetical protein
MCVETKDLICVDGYTLDYLKFNPNAIYMDLESVDGLREICILNSQNLSFIEMSPTS